MPYKKPTLRELITAYNEGVANHDFGLMYHNAYPVGSMMWMCRERGFRRAYKRSSKKISLFSIMLYGIDLAQAHKRAPRKCFAGKVAS